MLPLAVLIALAALVSPGPADPVLAASIEDMIESRWLGAWVVTNAEIYSDCAGFYTNNRVNGTLVNGKARLRFKTGELAKIDKVNAKRSRVDLFLTLTEPVLISYNDGPFTLYNEGTCRAELQVEVPRALIKKDNVEGIDAAIRPILERHSTNDDAQRSRVWNRRRREAYPPDYDRTLAEHAAWKARQVNAAVQARFDKALEEASRLTDRIRKEPAYLEGFAAGVESAKYINYGKCDALVRMDLASAQPKAPVAYANQTESGRGFQDGQRLVFSLELLRRLPQCFVEVPSVSAAR
jgi:hypothetical protein